MSKIGFLNNIFTRNSEIASSYDFEFYYESSQRVYLKELALETCINFIARTISANDVRFSKDNKRIKNDWDYLLNVRPNTDQSASDFWQSLIYKLINNNEVLIVNINDNLLIADSFYREEYALFPDIFSNVTYKNYTFNRKFNMDQVIYLTYNNTKLTKFMDGLFSDYADVFANVIDATKRAHQIRGVVDVESAQSFSDDNNNKLQGYIDKLFNAFANKTLAIVPQLKGMKYSEISDGTTSNLSIEEGNKLKRALTDDVAKILGIPTALVHGEMADLDKSMKAYIKFCINPLLKKIEDELNAKIFEKSEIQDGYKIEIRGIQISNVIENAEAVDKLVASGAYTRNEVREKFGDERADDPELDKYVITKNYQTVDATKGGE
ncbi:phage portal protein [Rummeliibacillus suwonensis]|uniref:phage portal protein n=1 Tax=Rummeliibacillus suwonensis TaxID=1306154 RepID=UPI0031456D9F